MVFDVVIVGARIAGCALAAHLGARGVRVALLDRAVFPSLPTVPSSPLLHAGTMQLLDELGVPEAAYGEEANRIPSIRVSLDGRFSQQMKIPMTHGRDYCYGIFRDRFDKVLWDHLAQFPTVERHDGFAVTKRVAGGISGHGREGQEQTFLAPWVVGADGRYSTIAKLFDAKITTDRNRHCSTVYYADWTGWQGGDAINIVTDGRGSDVLMIPGPEGSVSVNTHQRADIVAFEGSAETYYEQTVQHFAEVRRLLGPAVRASKVIGIKRIGNRFLQAGGPGWLLVGDAFHHKDPVDGQGIYDALLGARMLARILGEGLGQAETVQRYEQQAHAAMFDMFEETMGRLRRELYSNLNPLTRTLMRWTLQDPFYQERFLRFLARDISPRGWMSPRLLLGSLVRGMRRDLHR